MVCTRARVAFIASSGFVCLEVLYDFEKNRELVGIALRYRSLSVHEDELGSGYRGAVMLGSGVTGYLAMAMDCWSKWISNPCAPPIGLRG